MSNITITMSFDNVADLHAFFTGKPQTQATAPIPTPVTHANTTQADDSSGTSFDSDHLPTIGTPVHWTGARFDFDGVVERVNTGVYIEDDCKAVWVRRDDTGKLVSLTYDDIDSHTLRAI